MRKIFQSAFLILIIIGSVVLMSATPVSKAENSTNVKGIIDSDTTWTKEESPYSLTGLVAIVSGVTLTIEPGVTVNIGDYSLQVGGTLDARGRGADNITFVSNTAGYGNIAFVNGSSSWDEKNGSGCIIENAILVSTSISVNNASPKIYNSTISGNINVDNEGALPLISRNIIAGDVGVHSASPTIDHNSIIGGINIGGNSPIISNNIIEGGGVSGIGIKFSGQYTVNVSWNTIYGCSTGISAEASSIIAGNLVIDNDDGIELYSAQFQIQNNTIADNSIGIKMVRLGSYQGLMINSNNIQNNSQNSIYLEDTRSNIDATLNWWGTIEGQIISLTIHDRNDEPKLGSVSFSPTLSGPVPEAPATKYTPIEMPSLPSQEPSTTTQSQTNNQPSNQNGIYTLAIAAIILSVIINISLVIVVAVLLKKRH